MIPANPDATPPEVSTTVIVSAAWSGARATDFGGAEVSTTDLERLTPSSALEVLDHVPGVVAFGKGGAGGSSYLSLRGGEPNHTLVLLGGARVNDPTNSQGGSFDFAQLDPALFDGIDIYRGGLSAVHGADALSGVVSLRLRQLSSQQSLATLGATVDSVDGGALSATLGRGWDGGSGVLGAAWSDTGHFAGLSRRSRHQLLGRIAQNTGALQLAALWLHANSGRQTFPEDSGGERLALNRELERGRSTLDIGRFEISTNDQDAVRPRLAVNWTNQQADTQTPAIFPGVYDFVPAITANTRFRREEAVADARVRIGTRATAVVGFGYAREHGASTGTIDFGFLIPADFTVSRAQRSAFVEATVTPGNGWHVTAGTRLDSPSHLDSRWTSRLAISRQWGNDGPVVYANASQGYKVPSLYALAHPLIGNPSLQPEQSTSAEVGLRTEGNSSWRLAAFRTHYRDLIDFDPALFINVNRSRVLARGLEAEARRTVGEHLQLAGEVTWMDVVSSAGIPLRSRPKWRGEFSAEWNFKTNLRGWSAFRYTGSRFDSSVATGLVLASPYATLDAGLAWTPRPGVQWSAAALNLLDRPFEESLGTPSPGRMVRVGVRFAL